MSSPIRSIRTEGEPFRNTVRGNRDRNLASIFNEIREEIVVFLETRAQMVKAEVRKTLKASKIGLPLIGTCLVLVVTGFFLFTAAIVTLIASAFAGSAYAWFFAFVIVGFVWAAIGLITGLFAVKQFRRKLPTQAVAVLKADKEWLKREIRSIS